MRCKIAAKGTGWQSFYLRQTAAKAGAGSDGRDARTVPAPAHREAGQVVKFTTLSVLTLVVCAAAHAQGTFPVTSYGAKCDGTTDDTTHIQAALNAAAAAGGGTVTLPGATCLLNSNHQSSHPWFFYNLHIPSGVTLQGTTGSRLLQGPRGRHAMVSGATYVQNSVLAVGNNYQVVTYNGARFYPLNAITAGNNSVTLSTAGNASHFGVGDVISVYETNPAVSHCDVCATSIVTKVTSSNSSTGVVGLADPLVRTMSTPFIANQTSNTAHDIAVSDLIVQGAQPLSILETYNWTSTNVQYLDDTTIGGGNLDGNIMNTIQHGTWTGNTIDIVPGGTYTWHQEWPQRNSYNNKWSGNTIRAASFGGGEYAGNFTFTGNHFYLEIDGTGGNFALGAKNVKFDSNDVHTVGNQTAAAPWGSIITDVNAPHAYYPYVSNVQITNNTIQCVADGNNCLLLVGHGTVVSGNTITATGSATGINVAYSSAQVTNNTINLGNGIGILLNTLVNPTTVASNTLTGTGRFGIYVRTPPTRDAGGGGAIYNNTITGFAIPLYAPGARLGPTNIPRKNIH